MTRHAVIYARISAVTEESVSVARQLRSGRQYAQARGWAVVGEFVDEGVSATRNKLTERTAWQALLRLPEPFDAVIVWKVDRLARRVLDFLQTDESLQARGAALVCVEQTIDMTTGDGRAFAQMLAVFGEMETAAMSARRKAARAYLISVGRSPGGLQPYGWLLVPNPQGAGKVRAQDPERIDWVRAMVDQAMGGATVYSITRWLTEARAPVPRYAKPGRPWCYGTVDSLLKNPVLAGMLPENPGRTGGYRGRDVARDAHGQPVIAGDGILTVAQFDHLQDVVTNKLHAAAATNLTRKRSSSLLSLLASCAHCEVRMHRHGQVAKLNLVCPKCHQYISYIRLSTYLRQRVFADRGAQPMYRRTWIVPSDATVSRRLARLDESLRRTALALTQEDADVVAVTRELTHLKQVRRNLRLAADAALREVLVPTDRSLEQVWRLCSTDEQRRDIFAAQLAALTISRPTAHRGRMFDLRRVQIKWLDRAQAVVPDGVSLDAAYTEVVETAPWISIADAVVLTGYTETVIRNALVTGQIQQRQVHRVLPSISRASVDQFVAARIVAAQLPLPRSTWMTQREAAELIGCFIGTIQRAVARGRVQQRHSDYSKLPSLLRESVEAFAAERDGYNPQ